MNDSDGMLIGRYNPAHTSRRAKSELSTRMFEKVGGCFDIETGEVFCQIDEPPTHKRNLQKPKNWGSM